MRANKYEVIVFGTSAGGLRVIRSLVMSLPANFSMALIIIQHLSDASSGSWIDLLERDSKVLIKEADEKEVIQSGIVYVAPPNYHLLIERDRTFTLTVDERVNYARPAIDVTFISAAEAYGEHLIGVVATGANFDGAEGLKQIKKMRGMTIVQDPRGAEVEAMPRAAIALAKPDRILTIEGIIKYLLEVHSVNLADGNP
ncbi:chemotaxis protein CheB [Marinoscillum sp.]|uniref:chemotaxis protein CheB n=1 Tax=Marinoscillum sp. TaxID=2024838 RepID=UPI003BACE456